MTFLRGATLLETWCFQVSAKKLYDKDFCLHWPTKMTSHKKGSERGSPKPLSRYHFFFGKHGKNFVFVVKKLCGFFKESQWNLLHYPSLTLSIEQHFGEMTLRFSQIQAFLQRVTYRTHKVRFGRRLKTDAFARKSLKIRPRKCRSMKSYKMCLLVTRPVNNQGWLN